jgi:hypothetical protein
MSETPKTITKKYLHRKSYLKIMIIISFQKPLSNVLNIKIDLSELSSQPVKPVKIADSLRRAACQTERGSCQLSPETD